MIEPNNFRDVQDFFQDKACMDKNLVEIKNLNSTCWDKNYQPSTIDMTNDKNTG